MTPTIGRIVHVWNMGASEPLAGIVTKVWSETMINVHVFFDGRCEEYTSVELEREGAARFWMWPPRD